VSGSTTGWVGERGGDTVQKQQSQGERVALEENLGVEPQQVVSKPHGKKKLRWEKRGKGKTIKIIVHMVVGEEGHVEELEGLKETTPRKHKKKKIRERAVEGGVQGILFRKGGALRGKPSIRLRQRWGRWGRGGNRGLVHSRGGGREKGTSELQGWWGVKKEEKRTFDARPRGPSKNVQNKENDLDFGPSRRTNWGGVMVRNLKKMGGAGKKGGDRGGRRLVLKKKGGRQFLRSTEAPRKK